MLCWVKSDWLKLQGSIINISIQSQVGEQTEDPFTAPLQAESGYSWQLGFWGHPFLSSPVQSWCWYWEMGM